MGKIKIYIKKNWLLHSIRLICICGASLLLHKIGSISIAFLCAYMLGAIDQKMIECFEEA